VIMVRYLNVTDRQTDGRADGQTDDIPALFVCSISR